MSERIEIKIRLNNKKTLLNSKKHLDVTKTLPINENSRKNAFFIEGGGTRGLYAIGALKYLFEENPYIRLGDIDIFGGTSVGSYLATALSLGYNKDDLLEISKDIDLGNLLDSKYLFMVTLYRFMCRGYLYDDFGRRDIIEKILNFKIGTIQKHLGEKVAGIDLTFGHCKKLIAIHPTIYKHLIINVVDISRSDQIFMTSLDDKWTNIKLFDAILASSAIPFVFKPSSLYYSPNTNTYGYSKTDNSTISLLIDGGVSTNNPLDYFLINDELYSNYELWLLKFSSDPTYVKIDGALSLIKQLIGYLVGGKNDVKMDLIIEEYQINTINLNCVGGILDIYPPEKIQTIINEIYDDCLSGKISFGKTL